MQDLPVNAFFLNLSTAMVIFVVYPVDGHGIVRLWQYLRKTCSQFLIFFDIEFFFQIHQGYKRRTGYH